MLLLLGARKDLLVTRSGCSTPGGTPDPFPGYDINLSTLQPAPAAQTADLVNSQWKAVDLGGSGKLEAGDCELAEQLRDQLLPAFTTRNVQIQTSCVPHQLAAGGVKMSVEVLAVANGK